jgi:hypothetical protein
MFAQMKHQVAQRVRLASRAYARQHVQQLRLGFEKIAQQLAEGRVETRTQEVRGGFV